MFLGSVLWISKHSTDSRVSEDMCGKFTSSGAGERHFVFLGSVLWISKHSTDSRVSEDMCGEFTSFGKGRDILCFLGPFYGLASALLILG